LPKPNLSKFVLEVFLLEILRVFFKRERLFICFLGEHSATYPCRAFELAVFPDIGLDYRVLCLLCVNLWELALVVLLVVFSELLDVALDRVPQVLYVELSLLVLDVGYTLILHRNLLDALLC
jgi:hypothetical protein